MSLSPALENAFTLHKLFPLSMVPFPTSWPKRLQLQLAPKSLDQDLLWLFWGLHLTPPKQSGPVIYFLASDTVSLSVLVCFSHSAEPFKCCAAAAAKSLQSCPTLCDPRDGSPPGSPVPGIHQARTLVAISFSSAWKWSHSVESDSSRPHGLQPTRLLHPWDFPGKSTGVGCHFLLQCVKVKLLSRVRLLVTPWTVALTYVSCP